MKSNNISLFPPKIPKKNRFTRFRQEASDMCIVYRVAFVQQFTAKSNSDLFIFVNLKIHESGHIILPYNYIDGRQPKTRISIFFKNTFISVFGRKYHSTQSVKKL